MANHQPRVSVVVPFFDEVSVLQPLLDSYFSAKRRVPEGEVELIIVDNRVSGPSTQDFAAIARNDFKLVHCEKPGSYAARNTGFSHSRGRVVVFTDSDCRFSGNFFLELFRQISGSKSHLEIISGRVTIPFLEDSPVWAKFDSLTGIPQSHYAKKGYGATALLVVPRQVFEANGGFDENHYSGGDAEFCLRARRAGISFRHESKLQVFHVARSSMREHVSKLDRVVGAQISRWKGEPRRKFREVIKIFLAGFRIVKISFTNQIPRRRKLLVLHVGLILAVVRIFFSIGHLVNLRNPRR